MAKLQSVRTLSGVAEVLGYKPSGLSYLLYYLPLASRYTEFEIPKRNGSARRILAPTPQLKLLQRRLAKLLYLVLEDIGKLVRPLRPLSHGFAKNLSIVTNAAVHKRRRYVLNLDLKDFFPSINFGRVRGILIKDKRFGLDPKVATIIAQIACHENVLPQGSPCSPVLSNIVAHLLDIKLVQFAKAHKCTYSRYADDITFSTSAKDFPIDVAAHLLGSENDWALGAALLRQINKSGFEVNLSKTRMQFRGSRQVTTGLLVNMKPNIRPEYYRTARAMCWSLFNTGAYYRMVPAALAGGEPSDPDVKEVLTKLAPLEGALSHIHYVRDLVDTRQPTLKKKESTATRTLYKKFLFYKHFVAPDKPVLIPEGKTDSIYLRAAIEKLIAYHPRLGTIESGKLRSAIRFMNFSRTVHDILQLGTGTGELHYFISQYSASLKRYSHRPMSHPVIVLIDNDDGANGIFETVKKFPERKLSISLTSTDPFYQLADNLYLIKTPEIGSGGKSCIEDLFDRSLRVTKVGDKQFEPQKKHKEDGKYGKQIFAEKVVQAQKETIDFSKFSLLLDRIVAVLDHYAGNPLKL